MKAIVWLFELCPPISKHHYQNGGKSHDVFKIYAFSMCIALRSSAKLRLCCRGGGGAGYNIKSSIR